MQLICYVDIDQKIYSLGHLELLYIMKIDLENL